MWHKAYGMRRQGNTLSNAVKDEVAAGQEALCKEPGEMVLLRVRS